MNNNNQILIFGVLGIGIYFLMQQQQGSSNNQNQNNEKLYQVPGVGPVPQSQLPQYGYSFLFGQWLTAAQVQQVLAQYTASTGGNGSNAGAVADWINNVGGAVLGIIQAIGDIRN